VSSQSSLFSDIPASVVAGTVVEVGVAEPVAVGVDEARGAVVGVFVDLVVAVLVEAVAPLAAARLDVRVARRRSRDPLLSRR
jgi:hypothetical protein